MGDTLQLVIVLLKDDGVLQAVPISVFRLVRLIRLTRILRLFRHKAFKDLFAMVQGLTCGMATLVWAMVLFVVLIYIVSLFCRELLGPSEPGNSSTCASEEIMPYFKTVPRALFTVFRCSFGDCSTAGGTPLFEHIAKECPWWGISYSLFTFVVVVGLFNVISAIFVESTMTSAAELSNEKLQARLLSPKIWAVNVTKVLTALINASSVSSALNMEELSELEGGKCSDLLVSKLVKAEFPKALFDAVVKGDGEVRDAISNLDINEHEISYLSDILDPDNGGSVGMLELVDGLRRLRGEPRRGDIIAVDLMMRSSQEKIDHIWCSLRTMERSSTRISESMPAARENTAWSGLS